MTESIARAPYHLAVNVGGEIVNFSVTARTFAAKQWADHQRDAIDTRGCGCPTCTSAFAHGLSAAHGCNGARRRHDAQDLARRQRYPWLAPGEFG